VTEAAVSDPVPSWSGVPYLTASELEHLYSVEEFEPLAKERMTPTAYGFIAGWAGSGATTQANRAAFWRHVLLPRVLVNVETIDPVTTVLGNPISLPVMFAPSGYQRLAHPHGEMATARASVEVGTTMILSTSANTSIEDIGAVARNPWYQLYWLTDEELNREMVQRAESAGFRAIALTVDATAPLWRENEMRNPAEIPPGVLSVNTYDRAVKIAPNLTWKTLDRLRSWTKMAIVLKGVVTAEDARIAVDNGVEGLIVSNHGGRALDWAITSMDALPEVVEAVDGRLEVYMDGGVRRGTDVLKALALGARAVLIGRPVLWGIGTGGEAGIVRMMALIRGELTSVMGLCGAPTVAQISRDMVARRQDVVA
jgi:4-hydroxymandelate oxidase